jgi:endonuclease YncB( thermonuclease family)
LNDCPCRGAGGGGGGGGGGEPQRRFQTIRSRIIRVIDGDTIVIRPLERTKRPRYTVRLIGIDSPERSPKECGANLATENARRLAPRGRRVLLKTDPTQPMFDRFDRLLAYVRLPNGRQLNRAQLAQGWAKGPRRWPALSAVPRVQAAGSEGAHSGTWSVGNLRRDARAGVGVTRRSGEQHR